MYAKINPVATGGISFTGLATLSHQSTLTTLALAVAVTVLIYASLALGKLVPRRQY
ncbi:MAG: hypothetical protein ACR2F6_01195 [Mycobacteriales bacterium]